MKLKNITEIRWQLREINKRYGLNLTEQDIPLEESSDLSEEENLKVRRAWDVICNGNTLGIFQMASNVALPVLKKVQPRSIEALSAVNAFIRPGASGLDEYLAAKNDPSKLRKLDPRLDRHLEKTHGAIVYQEQIMFLISELMGISFGEADLYRRALEKPKKDKKGYVKKFNDTVVDIAISRGFDRDIADLVRQLIIDNSGYGFNKCFSGREKIYRQNNQYDTLTIAEMYKIKNDKEYAKKTGHLSLHKKYKKTYGTALSMCKDGRLKENSIVDIYYSGKKAVYLIETEDGKNIQCTMNHSFPTPTGKKILAELNIDDELYILDGYEKLLTKTSKITKIEYVCDEDVYDIEMANPYHNLLMNGGIVASNSHSIAYSIISYWTAYLKANYQLIFYTTMFNGNLDQLSNFMAEARKLNIKINPPHVCHSNFLSSIEEENLEQQTGTIRIGFNAVKGVGPKAVESILVNQPYSSIDDFFDRNQMRSVNKKVIEALIKANAFDGLGINIEYDDIPQNMMQHFDIKNINNKYYVNLPRKQMLHWYSIVSEEKKVKSCPNYLIPASTIKSKYLDEVELEREKDTNGYVIPKDRLHEIGIIYNDDIEKLKTRKKPKGIFKNTEAVVKIPIFRKPFVMNNYEIAQQKEAYLDTYLNEVEQFGFSFLQHPLEGFLNQITPYDSVEDGGHLRVAGILIEMVQRQTVNHKKYYWLILQTPREKVRVTIWDSQFRKHTQLIQKYKLLGITGKRGYGGMSCETIRELNPKLT